MNKQQLLPGVCKPCKSTGLLPSPRPGGTKIPCLDCNVTGRVWDEGIVEAVAVEMFKSWFDDDPGDWSMDLGHHEPFQKMARAVLSAIAELLTEKVER